MQSLKKIHAWAQMKVPLLKMFCEVQFVNKEIEFINLASLFKIKFVTSSVPTYFENKEPPSFGLFVISTRTPF